jgi:hypothetical protein
MKSRFHNLLRSTAFTLSLISLGIAEIPSKATVLFSQDFNSSSSISSYIGSGPGQWNAFAGSYVSVGIVNSALSYTRGSSGSGSFSRTTPLNPPPEAIMYKFILNVTGNSATTANAAIWQVGSGFGTASAIETDTRVHSRFGIDLTGTAFAQNTYRFIDQNNGIPSQDFSGPKLVTWVINNSGRPLNYSIPNKGSFSVGNDHWDMWVGNQQVFNEIGAVTAGQSLSNLKFFYGKGSGTITMDDFQISTLSNVPEPRWAGVMAATFAVVAVVFRAKR